MNEAVETKSVGPIGGSTVQILFRSNWELRQSIVINVITIYKNKLLRKKWNCFSFKGCTCGTALNYFSYIFLVLV